MPNTRKSDKSKDESIFLTRLIYYFLKAIQPQIFTLQKGQAQPHVYAEDLAQIKLPLLPISTQRKVVTEIEKWEIKEQQLRDDIQSLQDQAKATKDNGLYVPSHYLA